jgi:hypothetical protein
MDWQGEEGRDADKIYEDVYVNSWKTAEGGDSLVPNSYSDSYEEKKRYIDCSKSNKYNITQTLAERYGVFCVYEYKCDLSGRFIGAYEEGNKKWTGRKVIFYNQAIDTDNPLSISYQKNL